MPGVSAADGPSKVKKTVSLDGALVEQIDGNLGFEVNAALAARVVSLVGGPTA